MRPLPSLTELAYMVPSFIIALTFHEVAHGLAALALGDKTAKREKRISLNPLRHISWMGLLMLVLIGFGMAKPVMVDPRNFKNPKVDMALTAAAGPIMNFIVAFLLMLVMVALAFSPAGGNAAVGIIIEFLRWCSQINIMLGIFNMLPIPPLDGSKIFGALLPDKLYFSFISQMRFGMIIIMLLLITQTLGRILMPLIATVYGGILTMLLNLFA